MDAEAFRPRITVQLELNGFDGPLDLLLELARRQAVDIAKISAIDLADQFLAATSDLTQADLPMVADWLVMAAWLVGSVANFQLRLSRRKAAALERVRA